MVDLAKLVTNPVQKMTQLDSRFHLGATPTFLLVLFIVLNAEF